MKRDVLLVLLCSVLWQGCSTQKSELRCGYDALVDIWFPELLWNDATLCDVVQFMANEGERIRTGDWSPHFVIENNDTNIDIRPVTGDKEWPSYEFDPVKNPRLSLSIHKRITLREALDAVCEKTGFQWKAEETYVRIFKQGKRNRSQRPSGG